MWYIACLARILAAMTCTPVVCAFLCNTLIHQSTDLEGNLLQPPMHMQATRNSNALTALEGNIHATAANA